MFAGASLSAIALLAPAHSSADPVPQIERVGRQESPVTLAVTALDSSVPPRPWKFIVLHHTATAEGSVETIDAEHRQRRDAQGQPWRGIGYHFLIGNGRGQGDGEVRATFRWRDQSAGAHAGVSAFNETGIGVCLVGNFENTPPTPAQIASLAALCGELQTRFSIADGQILRHGDLKGTACPGKLFPRELFPAVAETAGRQD